MQPAENKDFMRPRLIEELELHETVHEYKIKTRQFIENTGKHVIKEEKGLIIIDAVLSSIDHKKNITNAIKCQTGYTHCPIPEIIIDTNHLVKCSDSTNFDPDVIKLIEIRYMTDDITKMEKKVRRIDLEDELYSKTFDPTECIDGVPILEPVFSLMKESAVYLINKNIRKRAKTKRQRS